MKRSSVCIVRIVKVNETMRITGFPWFVFLLAQTAMWSQGVPGGTEDANAERLTHVIETARSYDAHLPDFVCMQVTHRAQDKTRTGSHWKEYDNYEAEITYFRRQEACRLVKFKGKPSKRNCRQVPGYRSEGMFGALSSWIFLPDARTEFTFVRQEAIGSRTTRVYEYRVAQEHSHWQASFNARTVTYGFHGLVWADAATDSVVRIHAEPDSDPDTRTDVEYDFVTIAGQPFLLPVKAESRTSAGKILLRNTFEYSGFHKYAADASIEFGETKPDR